MRNKLSTYMIRRNSRPSYQKDNVIMIFIYKFVKLLRSDTFNKEKTKICNTFQVILYRSISCVFFNIQRFYKINSCI
jgi:hypothetical protein